MQGRNSNQAELFSVVDLSEMVPANHLLRRIDKVVDLSFIYELTADLYCEDNGRRSIDPVLFFRMQIVSYLYGISSDRRLCEEVNLNIAYRWFCRLNLSDPVPDHSSLTRIRDRFGEVTFQAIFERLILQWKKVGIVKGHRILADGSLVEANAGFNSMEEREASDPKARVLKQYERRYNDFREGKKQRKLSNQTHVSRSDPDATIVSRPGTYRKLSYKTHYAVDADSRMIVDCFATTGSKHEATILPNRIHYLIDRLHLPINEVTADRGYGRGPTYGFLDERKISAFIPLHEDNLGQGRISRGEFIYDKTQDRYQCLQGHYLYPYEKLDHGYIKRYRVVGGGCKRCPLKEACLPQGHKQRARFIYRSPHQEHIDHIRKIQNTPLFKKRLVERKWKIEGLFAEAKLNHQLRRAKYRGLAKTQIQFYMIAMVQNFKRLLKVLEFFLFFCISCFIYNLRILLQLQSIFAVIK